MLAYPNVRYQKVVHAEQRCVKCGKWFVLDGPAINRIETEWRTRPGSALLGRSKCRCGSWNDVIPVGKHDHPAKPKRECTFQAYKFKV